MAIALCVLMVLSCGARTRSVQVESPQVTEQTAIMVAPGQNREYSYSNKNAAFCYGYTNGYNDRFFQGLTDYRHKLFDEYYLSVDGRILPRSEARTSVLFHQIVRDYGQVSERITLLDGQTVLLVEVDGGRQYELAPVFPDKMDRYTMEWDQTQGILFVSRDDWLSLADEPDMPRWLGIHLDPSSAFRQEPTRIAPFDKHTPGSLSCTSERGVCIIFAAAHDKDAVSDIIADVRRTPSRFVGAKRERLEQLVAGSMVRADSQDIDQAIFWAKVSMDALVMNQDKRGIFAGLPWFNDYWGRDTFISLPGALLVTGQFAEARAILRDFATYQMTDPDDPLYGRIPNRVRPDEVIYNTADGTPWFVREAYEYVLYSGDTTFAAEIYPMVRRSIEGTIRYRIDENGFLKHDGADTWMDAKIEGTIPWSSRGDRACDIQALWYTQLIAGSKLAELVGEDADERDAWLGLAEKIRENFLTRFVWKDGRGVYDHLNADGTADEQYRPNQLFCLTVPFARAFSDNDARAVLNGGLGQVDLDLFAERLIYPFGVGSLWKEDIDFHPYHHHPNYHFDASYHNGIIWTWISGPAITAFCREGRTAVPQVLFESLTRQILAEGAVGTIPELIDAAPKPGESRPEFSGTFTQAWSLAEYLRNFYQDILGVYPLCDTYGFAFSPSPLAAAYGNVRFSLATKYGHILVHYSPGERKAYLSDIDLAAELSIRFYDRRYSLSPEDEIVVELPEWKIEPVDLARLASPEVPAGTRSLMEQDFLETRLREGGLKN